MSTITDELLLRIAVVGGAVAAGEVAAFRDEIAMTGDAAVGAEAKTRSFSTAMFSLKALFAGLFVGEAVKQFSSFQKQMEMLHTQTGATQEEVTRATKAVLGMAVSVGTGPNSLAQSLYHIESTQVRGKRAYDEMRTAAEGAKVGNADLVDVTNALNAVVVGKLLPGTNAFNQAMGQLNATVGSGDMVMQDLASAYSTGILKSLGAVGLKLIDVNSAMAVLGDNNIRGTQAANRLRMGLLQVVKPTNEAATQMHALHMSTYQLANDYYKPHGLYVMLEDLHQHLDKLGHDQVNNVLMTLFGRGRMSAGILTLYDEMGRLQSKYEAIGKGQDHFQQSWEATKKTLSFAIDQLKTLGEVVLIKVGAALAPVVKDLANFVLALEHGKTWAMLIAGPLLGLAAGFTAMKAAAFGWELVMLAAENIPIVALFAGIGLAVLLVIKHFRQLKEVGQDVFQWMKTAWTNIEIFVINAVNHVIDFLNHFIRIYDKIVGIVPGLGSHLQIGQIGYDMPEHNINNLVETGPGQYGLYNPGSLHLGGAVDTPGGGVGGYAAPHGYYGGLYDTPGGGVGRYQPPIDLRVYLDGHQIARSQVRQGLMSQARRGSGAATVSDSGAG